MNPEAADLGSYVRQMDAIRWISEVAGITPRVVTLTLHGDGWLGASPCFWVLLFVQFLLVVLIELFPTQASKQARS